MKIPYLRYPAVMKAVNLEEEVVTVHFVGWSTRFDFKCSLSSGKLRPASADVTIGEGQHLVKKANDVAHL
jgi:hypothetical protein